PNGRAESFERLIADFGFDVHRGGFFRDLSGAPVSRSSAFAVPGSSLRFRSARSASGTALRGASVAPIGPVVGACGARVRARLTAVVHAADAGTAVAVAERSAAPTGFVGSTSRGAATRFGARTTSADMARLAPYSIPARHIGHVETTRHQRERYEVKAREARHVTPPERLTSEVCLGSVGEFSKNHGKMAIAVTPHRVSSQPAARHIPRRFIISYHSPGLRLSISSPFRNDVLRARASRLASSKLHRPRNLALRRSVLSPGTVCATAWIALMVGQLPSCTLQDLSHLDSGQQALNQGGTSSEGGKSSESGGMPPAEGGMSNGGTGAAETGGTGGTDGGGSGGTAGEAPETGGSAGEGGEAGEAGA